MKQVEWEFWNRCAPGLLWSKIVHTISPAWAYLLYMYLEGTR